MKTKFFLFFLLTFLLVGTLALPLTSSEDVPKYNFGSAQGAKSLSGKPGQEVVGKIYFYNINGNRPTHVRLEILDKPDWVITLSPGIHNEDYDVSGVVTSVDENLVVYPSEAQATIGDPEEDKEWISSKVGYINANYVTINIEIPANAKIGEISNLKIKGTAFWLGQGGNIALEQEREFDYTITTTTEYYEKPLGEEKDEEGLGSNILSLFSSPSRVNPAAAILVGICFLLIVALIFLFAAARKKSKKKTRKKK